MGKAYKDAQHLLIKIDSRVHNEFVYASRAMASMIRQFLTEDINNKNFHTVLNDAKQATKHILGDCLDLILIYAITETDRISKICRFSNVSDAYNEYHKIANITKKLSFEVSETRKNRGNARIKKYIEMVSSDKYTRLLEYCSNLKDIEADLKKKRRQEINESRKWWFGIIIGIITITISIATSIAVLFGN